MPSFKMPNWSFYLCYLYCNLFFHYCICHSWMILILDFFLLHILYRCHCLVRFIKLCLRMKSIQYLSNIWTSSIKRIPGTISAPPSSLHYATFWSIYSLTSGLIYPMSPAKRAINPWIYNINFMQGNSMNNFFPLLKFSILTLDISCLRSLIIKITWTYERSSRTSAFFMRSKSKRMST